MKSTSLHYKTAFITGGEMDQTLSIHRPFSAHGIFADLVSIGDDDISIGTRFPVVGSNDEQLGRVARPTGFEVALDFGRLQRQSKLKLLRPIAPQGFRTLGLVCSTEEGKAPQDVFCIKQALTTEQSGEELQLFGVFEGVTLLRGQQGNVEIGSKPAGAELEPWEMEWCSGDENGNFFSFLRTPEQFRAFKQQQEQAEREAKESGKKYKEKQEFSPQNDGELIPMTLPVLPATNKGSSGEAAKPSGAEPENQQGDAFVRIKDDPMEETTVVQGDQYFAAMADYATWPILPKITEETTQGFIAEAVSFKLVGITSLTHPKDPLAGRMLSEAERARELAALAATISPEEYLYLYEPVPPPGYVALGLCLAKGGKPSGTVWCVSERYVGRTKTVQKEVGQVYGAQTAGYVYEFMQLIDLGAKERAARLRGTAPAAMERVSLVVARGSSFLQLKQGPEEPGYAYVLPEQINMLYSGSQASQRALLRALKAEPQADLIGEVLSAPCPHGKKQNGQTCLSVFSARLKKASHVWLYHVAKTGLNPTVTPELQAQVIAEKIKKLQFVAAPPPLPKAQKPPSKSDVERGKTPPGKAPKAQDSPAQKKDLKNTKDGRVATPEADTQAKKDEKKADVESADSKSAMDKSENSTALPGDDASYTGPQVPPEAGFYATAAGFEQLSIAEPVGFQVVAQGFTTSDEAYYVLRPTAPPGYVCLSDFLHVGPLSAVDLSRFGCVASCFCQEVALCPSRFSAPWPALQPALPWGTDAAIQAGLFPLVAGGVGSGQTGWILKDAVVQAYYQQEQRAKELKYTDFNRFDTGNTRVSLGPHPLLELKHEAADVSETLRIVNVEQGLCTYLLERAEDLHASQVGEDALQQPAENQNKEQAPEAPSQPELPDTAVFFTQVLASPSYDGGFSLNGILARPTDAVEMQGQIRDEQGRYYKAFRLVAPQGYVALGDVVSAGQSLSSVLQKTSCVRQELCTEITIRPNWALSGYLDTEGIWVHRCENGFLHAFDYPIESFKTFVLKENIQKALGMRETQTARHQEGIGYGVSDTLATYLPEAPLVSYMLNYCTNNRTTMHGQRLPDLGMHYFDSAMLLDGYLVSRKLSSASLQSFRLCSIKQPLTKEVVQPFVQQLQKTEKQLAQAQKEDAASIEEQQRQQPQSSQASQPGAVQRRKKEAKPQAIQQTADQAGVELQARKDALTASTAIDALLELGFARDLIAQPRGCIYTLQVNLPQRGPAYLTVSDKIPAGVDGALIQDRPAFYNVILKFAALAAGGYSKLFASPAAIVQNLFALFGLVPEGTPVLSLFLDQDTGELRPTPTSGATEIVLGRPAL